MTIEEWLGEENQLGMDIWAKKYCCENEDFEAWLTRISGGNEEIGEYIRQKKFLFGGRILSNRGLQKQNRKVTYSNCYVITPPEDEIESIFDCARKLARTYSYGGGCGTVLPCHFPDRTERKAGRAYDLHRLLPPGCAGVY